MYDLYRIQRTNYNQVELITSFDVDIKQAAAFFEKPTGFDFVFFGGHHSYFVHFDIEAKGNFVIFYFLTCTQRPKKLQIAFLPNRPILSLILHNSRPLSPKPMTPTLLRTII